jgi:DNA-binding IclR family transcriptional regulator
MSAKLDRTPPLLRAFALLEHVVRARGAVSLQEVTEVARLPKPTVYRMLGVLEEAGLVAREPEGRRVVAGPRLARFAHDVMLNEAVRAPRHTILKRLAEDVGETVNLTMLDRGEVVYLDRVETAWPLRMTLQPGSRVPLHGKLLLALLPAARRKRIVDELVLTPFTEHTIVDRRRFDTELANIRRAGLATDNEEYLAGLVCVAVPVSAGGRVAACVAVHAPVARMPLGRAMGHLPALRRAADALGATFDA